jgi:hypothetical protein
MSDIQDLRARVRDTSYEPEQKSGLPFWIVTACAVALGFTVVLFVPRFYTVQRTAALPEGRETAERIEKPVHSAPAVAAPVAAPAPSINAAYAGKSTDEIAKLADSTCMQRATSALLEPKPKSKAGAIDAFAAGQNITDDNNRLACQLTEAPARYCSRSPRQKITAEIISYFVAVEQTNASARMVIKAQSMVSLDTRTRRDANAPIGSFVIDPRVVSGIEGLIRAGYLQKPQRDDINAVAPRPIKERLDRIVGIKTPCPVPPWWAVWR